MKALCKTVLATLLALTVQLRALCEEPLSYPTSPQISPSPLDSERRELLHKLIYLSAPKDYQDRADVREKLCPEVIKKPDPAQLSVKAALTVVEPEIYAEILFRKGSGPGVETSGEEFSVLVNMDTHKVLIKSSRPRFLTESAGLSIAYSSDHTRPMWLEGKDGTNFLLLLPTIQECGVQAVVICSRTYDPRSGLVQSKYLPVAARYFIKAKADGLFSAGANVKGKIMASILGSPGVPVPTPWFKENTSSSTPSVTLKALTAADSKEPFTPISLPANAAVEARLDFGTEANDQRTVWSRANLEISEFPIKDWPPVHVRTADLKVESGTCFQVTQWKETQF